MGRPREFDTETALESAMQVFWSKGYEATSLADLIGAMGISKSSFYDTFGSKHELYVAALDRYQERFARRGLRARIKASGGGKQGIVAVFERLVAEVSAGGERRGCFINNTAVELAGHDAQCCARVEDGFACMTAAFQDALVEARGRGEIGPDHEVEALAGYLTASLNGLLVLAKGAADRAHLEAVAGIVTGALD